MAENAGLTAMMVPVRIRDRHPFVSAGENGGRLPPPLLRLVAFGNVVDDGKKVLWLAGLSENGDLGTRHEAKAVVPGLSWQILGYQVSGLQRPFVVGRDGVGLLL